MKTYSVIIFTFFFTLLAVSIIITMYFNDIKENDLEWIFKSDETVEVYEVYFMLLASLALFPFVFSFKKFVKIFWR